MRRLPYPYSAMLAVCSDLDETPDRHVYRETMRFLNTTETTSMGPGVGLEIGNTIYFYMPPGQFSYWNTDERGREMVRAMIRSGHVDCLHSFGNLATDRTQAGAALDELSRHGCNLEVWIDHAVAPTNFGADIMKGSGDVPGSPAYHADLTLDFGIRYVWRGRVTSVVGQDVRRSLGGVFTRRHPCKSAMTVLKEFGKGMASRLGSEKYAMHGKNDVVRPVRLRNERNAWEFMRSNPHWGGAGAGANAAGIADALSDATIRRLIDREGVCVLYTHLGKIARREEPLGRDARRAFEILADYMRAGKVLVTTTRRLLGYCRTVREATCTLEAGSDGGRVHLSTNGTAGKGAPGAWDLDGLTFYVPNPEGTSVFVDGREVRGIIRNGPDGTGQRSVSIPWRPLEFPGI